MIHVIEHRFLRGPNLHSRQPCLQLLAQTEGGGFLEETHRDTFADALLALLPSLKEHRGLNHREGGLIAGLREQGDLPFALAHVLLELQCLAGAELRFCRSQPLPGAPGRHRIAVAYASEPVAEAAVELAGRVLRCAAGEDRLDMPAALKELRRLQARHGTGPSTAAIVGAAHRRGIPVMRLSDNASLFQLGWGKAQHRVQATITDQTSHIAVEVASDKELTKELLAAVGVPVPKGDVVSTLEQALSAARRIGGAVAIKPLDGNQGKGVSTHLRSDEDIARAFKLAQDYGDLVIVEQTIEGDDHRVLVVNGRMVAASRRAPPTVVGDGVSTIAQLVERENADPLRGEGHESALTQITLDEHALAVLAEAGRDAHSVVPPGEVVPLRTNSNLSTGGTAEDVTERVHPWTAELCVRAALQIGLDVAGIDLVCTDISRPLEEQSGAVIEVNAAPGIRMHESPSRGLPQPAGRAIVESLFPDRRNGRIPVVAVTGTNGKTTTTLVVATALMTRGVKVGYTTTEGVYFGGRRTMEGDCTGYWSARSVLCNPQVEAAVLESARGGILKRGLAFDECDVAIVLNVSDDHIGQDGIETVDDLARVKAVVADTASRAVVLNAEDRRCVAMAPRLRSHVEVIYFAEDPQHPAVQRHLQAGGKAIVLDGDMIVVQRLRWAMPIVDVRSLPFTLHGRARHNVQNALAAVGALVALDESPTDIAVGLQAFHSTAQANPLRFNVFNVRGVQVIVDYAHNVAAYRALAQSVRGVSQGKVVGVVSAPGDRRDAELQEVGRVCAEGFDEVIVYEMDEDRGRARGDTVPPLLRGAQMVAARGAAPVAILDTREALREGLRRCQPGDTLVFGNASDLEDLFAVTGAAQPYHEIPPVPSADDLHESEPWPAEGHALNGQADGQHLTPEATETPQ
ncbi:cyanophycin synthetase [Ideonella sp. BN130291]|uniref:cyanophycin synthetase n=1 Tax=Ideonella sp. BN130291 TaxID=3112940 RepID=UPI002E26A994|nr:cyanophycin synthetase [Ideonella sp. BN130291]